MGKKDKPVRQSHRRPWKCPVPGCNAEYSTSGALDRHVATAPPEKH